MTLYIDDTLSTGEDEEVQCFREKLRKRIKCRKGGLADHYIGIQVEQTNKHISLNQKQYLLTKLEEFGKFLGSNQRFACATPLIPQFQGCNSSAYCC